MEEFDGLRPSAFALAYRMLGSVSEAEDVVKEGFLRLHRARAGGERVESPRAYLSTVVSRLSLDHLRSARSSARPTWASGCRSRWWRAPTTIPPARPRWRTPCRSRSSSCSRVCPPSSAPRSCCARCSTSPTTGSRRSSARPSRTPASSPHGPAATSSSGVPRFEASRAQREELATRFFAAAQEGDLEGLEELLAHDVVFRGDGGGKAPAAARAIHGRARVARLLIAGMRALARTGGFTTRREEVNGQPGALFVDRDGRLVSVATLDIADGQIQGVSAIVNPDKLLHLGPVGDLRALLRERR